MVPTSKQPALPGYQNITFDGTILILCNTNITCDYILSHLAVPLFFSHIWWYYSHIMQYQHHMWLYFCHIWWFPYFFLTFYGTILTLCSTNITCDCTFVTFGGLIVTLGNNNITFDCGFLTFGDTFVIPLKLKKWPKYL